MYAEGRRPRPAGPLHRGRLSIGGEQLCRSPGALLSQVISQLMCCPHLQLISFSAIIDGETPMGYYALFYREVVPDFVAQRAAYREEHLGLAREAHSRGELLLAGALADPPDGALLVFRGGDDTPAQEFVRKDPYVRNGLVKRWEIRPWTVVVGNQ